MRVALICPSFPPDSCGVGDYSANLAMALHALGVEVRVWTSQERPILSRALTGGDPGAPGLAGVPRIERVAAPWGRRSLERLRAGLRDARPDAVVLQYTPQLWAPATLGVQPLLPLWLAGLRRELGGVPLALTAHELHYPAELSPRGILLGIPQVFQFLALAGRADRVFFTYEAAMESTSRRLPWRKDAFSVLPVGSNIPPPGAGEARPDPETLRRRAGIGLDRPLLLHFGGMHPTHRIDYILHALEAVSAGSAAPVQVFAGISHGALLEKLTELGMGRLASRVRGLGYLDASEVSGWLLASDLVLAPFLDGVSTRRGSFMAALAHGRCVITTRGRSTSGAIPWERFCLLAPGDSAEAYATAVARALARPEQARWTAAAGRRAYEERFAWSGIAGTLLDRLSSSSGSRSMTPAKNQKKAASGL